MGSRIGILDFDLDWGLGLGSGLGIRIGDCFLDF